MAEHSLPPLPYAHDALAPTISKETMEFHHDKHHAAYVNNLNAALKDHPDLQGKSAEDLIVDLSAVPEAIRTAVRNNAGGHVNHTLFWEIMTPGGATAPGGRLLAAIEKSFGSVDSLKAEVNKAGAGRFGSGWAWVIASSDGDLSVVSTPNQDSPLMDGKSPILGVDVWEHAYYIDYRNRRPDYLTAWWSVLNWDKVAELYAAATR